MPTGKMSFVSLEDHSSLITGELYFTRRVTRVIPGYIKKELYSDVFCRFYVLLVLLLLFICVIVCFLFFYAATAVMNE